MSGGGSPPAGLSPAKQALLARRLAEYRASSVDGRIPRRSTTGPARLSSAQRMVWLFEQMTPGTAAYHVPIVRRVRGAVDTDALRRALETIVARHEILRTTYHEIDGEAVQVVHATMPVELGVTDVSGSSGDARTARAIAVLKDEAIRPFDLGVGPMLRAHAIQMGESGTLLLLLAHHIAVDGASIGVLLRELSALYGNSAGKAEPTLPTLPIQYGDYAEWELTSVPGERLERLLAYWRAQLAGAPGSVTLPLDRPRDGAGTGAGARAITTLPPTLAKAVARLASDFDTTPFVVLLAGFQSVLHRYSGQDDIVVGVPTAGRNRPETQDLIGYFVNTLALRARFNGDPTFAELLAAVRRSTLDAFDHQDLPYERLLLDLHAGRPATDGGLFSVMFALQDSAAPALRLGEAQTETAAIDVGASKFDLSLSVMEAESGLRVSVEYRADLFDAGTIERFVSHYQTLLRGAIDAPATRISELPLMTRAERHRVLVEWNDTAVEYPRNSTLHELLAAQARRTPEMPAIVAGQEVLTFLELDARASRLAVQLQRSGVGSGHVVAVAMLRSSELIVALLAVLKTGSAYLPIDPHYPPSRIAFMLGDSNAIAVLTQPSLASSIPAGPARVIPIEPGGGMVNAGADGGPAVADRSSPSLGAESLAYLMYTSGSTGRPKGTRVTHRGLVNYLWWSIGAYFHGGVGAPLHTSISFDLTITGLWSPLLAGCAVHVLPEGDGVESLAVAIRAQPDFTLIKLTPAHLEALRHALGDDPVSKSTRMFVIGGEQLFGETLSWWHDHAPGTTMVNEYGPTETVVGCCASFVEPGRHIRGAVPIGRPIANTRLYVLDQAGQPSPIGLPGELFIAGDGVALGYHDRPELTAERFVANPFSAKPGDRMYRTGDRARWRADGTLEYLGRLDHQVKIRGFRVELGEVEAVLAAQPGVAAAAAVVREVTPGDSRLTGYVAPTPGAKVTAAAILSELRRTLPGAMVPTDLVVLDALPLTPNGKVDRNALPEPTINSPEEGVHVAPTSPVEEVVASLWSEVLRRDRIGVDQDFFTLGGHSLLAMQVVARIARVFRTSVPLRRFFEHPTVAGLATELTVLEPKPGQADAIARAVLRLRAMSPAELAARRDAARATEDRGTE